MGTEVGLGAAFFLGCAGAPWADEPPLLLPGIPGGVLAFALDCADAGLVVQPISATKETKHAARHHVIRRRGGCQEKTYRTKPSF